MSWFKRLFLQETESVGVEHVKREVELIKSDVGRLKEQVEALEAFRDLVKDAK